MYTSVCKNLWRNKAALAASAGCLALALGYQAFGHGVRSTVMTLCCLPPLAFVLLDAWREARLPGAPRTLRQLLGAGAATTAVGMFLQGVLEIAGADSPYLRLFYIVGGAEAALALGMALAALGKGERG